MIGKVIVGEVKVIFFLIFVSFLISKWVILYVVISILLNGVNWLFMNGLLIDWLYVFLGWSYEIFEL